MTKKVVLSSSLSLLVRGREVIKFAELRLVTWGQALRVDSGFRRNDEKGGSFQ
jgi:hypothetical protein